MSNPYGGGFGQFTGQSSQVNFGQSTSAVGLQVCYFEPPTIMDAACNFNGNGSLLSAPEYFHSALSSRNPGRFYEKNIVVVLHFS